MQLPDTGISLSKNLKNPQHFPVNMELSVLQIPLYILQLLSDLDALGAMLLTFAAADAGTRVGGILPEQGAAQIFPLGALPVLRVVAVVGGKGTGDIHILGAGLAVAAAGAAHLDPGIDGSDHLCDDRPLPFSKGPHRRFRASEAVFIFSRTISRLFMPESTTVTSF